MIFIILIIIIGIISYFIDINTNKHFRSHKRDFPFNLMLLGHHILAVFMILGIFSNNITILKIHAISLLIIYVSWFIYKDNCLITFYTNKYIGIDTRIQFRSIFGKIGQLITGKKQKESQQKDTTEYIIIPLLASISLFKIGYLSKNKN